MKLTDKLYNYAFALLVILFPFSKALPNIVIAVLAVFLIIDHKNVNFKRLLQGPIVVLYILLLYLFIKAAINQSLFTEFTIYKKLIILYIMPVLFLKIKDLVFFKTSILISILTTVIVSIFMALSYYIKFGSLPFTTGETVNTLMVLERPYAGFYAFAGALLSFDLIKYLPKYEKALISSILVCAFFIVFVVARMSFLSLLLCVPLYILFYAKIPKKVTLGIIGGGALAVLLLFMFNKNIAERFYVNKSLETASDYEPRVVIWDCGYHMLSDSNFNMFFGFSSNKVIEDNYLDCYSQKIDNPSKRNWFITTNFNSHNQFNDYLLAHGFIGLLLLCGFMGYLIYYARKSFPYTAITLGLVLFLLVENVLHRQMGCYIFSTFVTIVGLPKIELDGKN